MNKTISQLANSSRLYLGERSDLNLLELAKFPKEAFTREAICEKSYDGHTDSNLLTHMCADPKVMQFVTVKAGFNSTEDFIKTTLHPEDFYTSIVNPDGHNERTPLVFLIESKQLDMLPKDWREAALVDELEHATLSENSAISYVVDNKLEDSIKPLVSDSTFATALAGLDAKNGLEM